MIFIINETKQKLKLKATVEEEATVLSVLVNDAKLPIVSTQQKKISDSMIARFGEPEEIRNKNSRHNFRSEGTFVLIDQYPKEIEGDPTGLEGTFKLISQKVGTELPKKYTMSKDIVVFIHACGDVVDMDKENLTMERSVYVQDERSEFAATIFAIKWYDWSRLHIPVCVYINGDAAYQLSSVPHNKIESRTLNAVRSIRKRPEEKETESVEKVDDDCNDQSPQ